MGVEHYCLDREIPVVASSQVVVVGGGPGGIGAAVMAARAGASVTLVERYACLGGMATVGEVHPFMSNHRDGDTMDKPVFDEWRRRILSYLPEAHRQDWALGKIHKEAAMLAAEDLCLEAGVKILYHHSLIDVITDGRRVKTAVVHSKSGFTAVEAEVFVDSTGDGDLAALAGCGFEMGGPSGHCQPMTTCFKMSGVKRTPGHGWGAMQELRERMSERYQVAKDEGRIECPRDNVLCFDWFDEDVVHFNTTRVIHKNGVDGLALSEAEIEARRQVRQLVDFLRRDIPEFAGATLHSIAHHIGVRETRRVIGLATATIEDFDSRRKYPDAIARVNYPIDIHNPDGAGTVLRHLEKNEWYEIPYACIVVRDMDNLLMGCRAISVDHGLHSSMRVMPPVCTIGQAAGMAAAIAARDKRLPKDIDGVELRRRLVEAGADL